MLAQAVLDLAHTSANAAAKRRQLEQVVQITDGQDAQKPEVLV
jgi:hypothetical protein